MAITIAICPICKTLAPSSHNFLMSHNIFCEDGEVVGCNNCGFIWSNRQLDDFSLVGFYKDKYRAIKGETLDCMRLRNDLQRASSQYAFFCDNEARSRRPTLEIGAGYGVLSKYLHKKGFVDINVVEPDAVASNALHSCVDIFHVLEHVFDLNVYMNKLKSMMGDDSILFVEVPNCENKLVYSQSGNSFHYWFFTLETLVSLFEVSGFEVIKIAAFGKERFSTKGTNLSNKIREYEPSAEEAYWLRGCFKVTS